MDNRILDKALSTPILHFTGVYGDQSNECLQASNALLLLILEERTNGICNCVHSRILAHIRNSIKGGNEPCADCNHYWAYVPYTCAITLAKNTPTIWNDLTEEEKARLDLIMLHMALSSNFMMNDANEYKTGLSRNGNVSKNWSPNFRISLLGPIIAVARYFESEQNLNSLLFNYNYDYFISLMREYGFYNMLTVWERTEETINGFTVPGVQTVLDGGPAYIVEHVDDYYNLYYGGEGQGARILFQYKQMTAGDIGLLENLLDFCYSGGAIFSSKDINDDGVNDIGILNNKVSPYEGQDGLMLEFNNKDMQGIRSHAYYCEVDFIMIAALVSMLKEIEDYDIKLSSHYTKVNTGTEDLFFKLQNGYISHAGGAYSTVLANNIIGYLYAKTIWEEYCK